MARNIKRLDWHLYIPKWDGNDKEIDPISLEIHPLSHRELSKYVNLSDDLKNKSPEMNLEISKKIFVDNVRNVKNLKINDASITDSEPLWDFGISDPSTSLLINEISAAILDLSKLQDHEKKI